MRRNGMALGWIVAFTLAGAGDAIAQEPASRSAQRADMPVERSFDADSGDLPATGATASGGATVLSPGDATAAPPVDSRPRTATPLSLRRQYQASCRRVGTAADPRVRCVVSRVVGSERRVVKRCTFATNNKRKAARRCIKRARSAQMTVGGDGRRLFSLQWQGFPGQAMPTVGKIVFVQSSWWNVCSGTVVSRSVVLTAGHCLTDGKPEVGWFAPGATATQADRFDSIYAPYGWWEFRLSRSWVDNAWAQSRDHGRDWGLMEIRPDARGRLIGDVVGSWSFTTNISWGTGANAYLTGYPASGWWENEPAGLRGRAQYACNTTWDGKWQYEGSGSEIQIDGCPMNGGASGGPWFIRLNNGAWTIGGVNNRCQTNDLVNRPGCEPYGDALLSAYMNGSMLAFWNAVVPQLQYE